MIRTHVQLLRVGPPYLHIALGTAGELAKYLDALQTGLAVAAGGDAVVRALRGAEMRTYAALYGEFASALEFPSYFGNNLNALRECLSDMEWLPGAFYVVAIADADQLLGDEDTGAPAHLFGLLAAIAAEWSQGVVDGPVRRPPTPFHVILHSAVDAASRSKLVGECAEAQVEASLLGVLGDADG